MMYISIKRITATIALVVTLCGTVVAQDLTSYYMPDAVSRMSHNAAFAPDRGYFNIPMVGSVALMTNGNMSLSSVLHSVDGELLPLLDTDVSISDALSPLDDINTLGVESRIGLLGFGAYCKDRKAFWSFEVNLRTSANYSIPYEFFEFFKAAPDFSAIRNVEIYTDNYIETVFGYSKPINDKITVGGRFKLLAGLANASLSIDKLDLTLSGDEWSAQAEGTLDINAAGTTVETDENGKFDIDDIDFSPDAVAGYGAAVDLGVTYDHNDRLQFSFSVNDLGFISWKKGCNTTAKVANNFSFSGASVEVGGGTSQSDTEVNLEDIEFELQESSGQTKWLQANINAGAQYTFFDERLGVGGIYSARFWRSKTVHNFTTSLTFCPVNWFTLATSYTLTNNSANAIGFAANFATGFVNLYVATDILTSKKSAQYIPIDQSAMNFTFGLAIPIGRKGERL